MMRLETERDGWLFAIATLGALEGKGSEACRCNAPMSHGHQADPLVRALLSLKERGTCDAVAGFGAILTDLIGTRGEPIPSFYAELERAGRIRRFKMKRLVNRGHKLAVLSLNREATEISAK